MDVVSIGETMVLFTPREQGQMRYSRSYTSRIAGAETNTLIGLAKLGHRTGWISQVGQDEFGAQIMAAVRGEGVDTSQTAVHPSAPTGVFYKERLQEASVRVYYYRQGSAASLLVPESIDENYIARAKYLYLTGITPALSPNCREAVFHAIGLARKHGVQVVFDPNLRRKLWSDEEAREVLTRLCGMADLVLAGISEGTFLFGDGEGNEDGDGKKSSGSYLAERFLQLGCKAAILKLGAEGAYYATGMEQKLVPGFKVDHVADPVGAGDGFAAGVLSGLLDGLPLEEAVRRGCAIGAAVVTVNGDIEGLPDRELLAAFMSGRGEDVAR
jgi:2-dehydro-3-deoxygluconokinase